MLIIIIPTIVLCDYLLHYLNHKGTCLILTLFVFVYVIYTALHWYLWVAVYIFYEELIKMENVEDDDPPISLTTLTLVKGVL